MPWNPQQYNQFKSIRYQPFFDLMELISENNLSKAVDIGCGTGEQTHILAEKFANTNFTGIDSSKEMLAEAESLKNERLSFDLSTTEEFVASQSKWDLIFSNAALQWSNDHDKLFPALIAQLNEGGQFAVQMPVQKENLLNKILLDLVKEKPFVDQLNGWCRESPVLSIDEYASIMFDAGLKEIQIIQKVYPIIAEDAGMLLNFISSTTLMPYLERLPAKDHTLFTEEFKKRIERAFKKFPAMYAFKRLLLYGRKEKL